MFWILFYFILKLIKQGVLDPTNKITVVVSHPPILKMLMRRAGIYIYYLTYG